MHIKKKITDIYGRRDIHPEEARSRQLTYGFPLNELALSTEVLLFPLQLTHVLSSCLVVLRVIILTRYKFSSSQLYFLRALIFVLYRALPIGLIVQVIDPCLFFPVFNQNPSQNSRKTQFPVIFVAVKRPTSAVSARMASRGQQFPPQTQEKQPGKEHVMDPLPQYISPDYKPSNKLRVWSPHYRIYILSFFFWVQFIG